MRWFALTLFSASAAFGQQAADSVAPEQQTAQQSFVAFEGFAPQINAKMQGTPVVGNDWMVAAANPFATEVGANILREGGSAADALVAVQAVLGLIEPQSSGLGGGAFVLWYDAKTGDLTTYDGRETAPLAATPTLFQKDGETLAFFDAVVGGRSVGVPGVPALLENLHRAKGKLPWADVLAPALDFAEQGLPVSPRLAAMVAGDADRLGRHPETAAHFLPDGEALSVGQSLENPAYAQTLRHFITEGAATFYTGAVSQQILEAVQGAKNPGLLSAVDLAIYQTKTRPPVCVTYRSYEVCGMGPPSSGGLSVGQILGVLNAYDLAALGPDDPESWRLIGDATRLAFADRGRYIADADFVPVPSKGLLEPAYLAKRAKLLGDAALPEVSAGHPKWDHAQLWADDVPQNRPSTTHISIVDSDGNVAAMTSSVENAFGSRVMAGGMLLNNQLTDFSFRAHHDGVPIANRVEPGKRPRSSMAPTIVFKDRKPVLVIGSPGGSRIIPYVAKTIIAWADWDMNIQEAINLPHAVNRFGSYDLESGTDATELAPALESMGYEVNIRDLNSGLHAIEIGATLQGAADIRREGIAIGE